MNTNPTNSPSDLPPSLSQEDRNWATIAHLSAFGAFVIPALGGIIGPLVVWLLKRDHSAFAGEAAKEALNFNITVAIAGVVCTVLVFVVIGIPLLFGLFIAWLVLTIIAGVRSSEGVQYRYPATIRFIK